MRSLLSFILAAFLLNRGINENPLSAQSTATGGARTNSGDAMGSGSGASSGNARGSGPANSQTSGTENTSSGNGATAGTGNDGAIDASDGRSANVETAPASRGDRTTSHGAVLDSGDENDSTSRGRYGMGWVGLIGLTGLIGLARRDGKMNAPTVKT